jgi:hypothetical protein
MLLHPPAWARFRKQVEFYERSTATRTEESRSPRLLVNPDKMDYSSFGLIGHFLNNKGAQRQGLPAYPPEATT